MVADTLNMMKLLAGLSLILMTICGGCSGGGSISSWQKSVEGYVSERGKGDPLVLRDVTLPDGRRGFATIGAPVPAESNDINGVLVGHRAIDGQNAFAKGLIDGYEPLFERVGFGGVFRTDFLNATADFTDYQHAKIQARILDFFIPSCDVWIASATLSNF